MKPGRRHKPQERNSRARHGREGRRDTPDTVRIYGLHAAEAALANPRRTIRAVYATPNAAQRVAAVTVGKGPAIRDVTPKDLGRMLGEETVHQGILVEAAPLPEPGPEVLENARLAIVLDQITDPHNAGAILRSAAAFGADCLIMTARHSPPLAGALAKAASGGLEHVPVMLPANLAQALRELGNLGFMRIGLDSGGDIAFEDLPAPERLAIVLGAENRGLRRLTAETCDAICTLSTTGPIRSLNVSNAAAIALHTAVMKRKSRPGL